MTGHGSSLAGNTLHSTAVTEEAVCVVVEEVVVGLVEGSSGLSLGNGETNSVGETLTQRTSGDLNTGSVVRLGVTGGLAVKLLKLVSFSPDGEREKGRGTYTEALQVVHGNIIAEKVQQSILQHTTVTVGENETIPVDPVGVLGVEVHELVEENVGHGSHAHGGTGVPRVGLEGGINLRRS